MTTENRRRRRIRSLTVAAAALALAPAAAAPMSGCLGGPAPGAVDFEGADAGDTALAERLGAAAAERYLAGSEIDARRDLVVRRVAIDELSMAHTRMQQLHRGVPVLGGEIIVHLESNGSLFAVTDTLVRGLPSALDPRPTLDAGAAIARAVAETPCPEAQDGAGPAGCLTAPPAADLVVLRRAGDHLAFRVALERLDGTDATALPVVFIDAHTGAPLWRYDDLQTGAGVSLYSGVQSLDTYNRPTDNVFFLQDVSRRTGTFDGAQPPGSPAYSFTDDDDDWNATAQHAAVDIHYCAGLFYDYIERAHGHDGIDGQGGPGTMTAADGSTPVFVSQVHYGNQYNNAFWSSSSNAVTYGDGDGVRFSPLVTLDVCGHEMMHGVTYYTGQLIYAEESGALNESWSDVFGAMLERLARGESEDTWKIGEACFTPGTPGDALRFMADPHRAADKGFTADDDPSHYAERYTGIYDNGGVHINSGIANKAFYLLAAGGAGRMGGTMEGIGADAAAAIWFKAMKTYMTSGTNFAGARLATMNAAAAIYGAGGPEQRAVERAWSLCGVGECGAGATQSCCKTIRPDPSSPRSDPGGPCYATGTQTCSTLGSWGPCR